MFVLSRASLRCMGRQAGMHGRIVRQLSTGESNHGLVLYPLSHLNLNVCILCRELKARSKPSSISTSIWKERLESLDFTDLSLKFKVVRECAETFSLELGNRELTNITNVPGLLKTLHALQKPKSRAAANAFGGVDTVEQLFINKADRIPSNVYFKAPAKNITGWGKSRNYVEWEDRDNAAVFGNDHPLA
ncbi:hypothetical protein BC829DRAFT_379595 [Chytridium lagenaria]|nr:hypothetical protein BC829DRAFT_379595 [Chytridium lagenaria]